MFSRMIWLCCPTFVFASVFIPQLEVGQPMATNTSSSVRAFSASEFIANYELMTQYKSGFVEDCPEVIEYKAVPSKVNRDLIISHNDMMIGSEKGQARPCTDDGEMKLTSSTNLSGEKLSIVRNNMKGDVYSTILFNDLKAHLSGKRYYVSLVDTPRECERTWFTGKETFIFFDESTTTPLTVVLKVVNGEARQITLPLIANIRYMVSVREGSTCIYRVDVDVSNLINDIARPSDSPSPTPSVPISSAPSESPSESALPSLSAVPSSPPSASASASASVRISESPSSSVLPTPTSSASTSASASPDPELPSSQLPILSSSAGATPFPSRSSPDLTPSPLNSSLPSAVLTPSPSNSLSNSPSVRPSSSHAPTLTPRVTPSPLNNPSPSKSTAGMPSSSKTPSSSTQGTPSPSQTLPTTSLPTPSRLPSPTNSMPLMQTPPHSLRPSASTTPPVPAAPASEVPYLSASETPVVQSPGSTLAPSAQVSGSYKPIPTSSMARPSPTPSSRTTSNDPANQIGDNNGKDRVDGTSTCFPKSASVQLDDGKFVRMFELVPGNRVLAGDGEYSEILAFTHSDPLAQAQFITLATSGGLSLTLTPGHILPVNGILQRAEEARPGDVVTAVVLQDHLWTSRNDTIQNIQERYEIGLYNPQTARGDIVVDGVLASCYTDAVEPMVAHALLTPLRSLALLDDAECLRRALACHIEMVAGWISG